MPFRFGGDAVHVYLTINNCHHARLGVDKYAGLGAEVAGAFADSKGRYGYRRIKAVLKTCVCSIESGPCERVDVFHVSGRFWSTSACGEKRTPARPAWTSFPS